MTHRRTTELRRYCPLYNKIDSSLRQNFEQVSHGNEVMKRNEVPY